MATPSITQTSLHFYHRALKFCRQPISHLHHHPHLSPATPIRSHSHTRPLILNHTHTHAPLFNSLRCSLPAFNHLGSPHFLVSAMPDGGGGGGYGSFGGGASGGGGDGAGGGGDKCSLLSWYLALLGKYPIAVKALTSAVLTLIGDLICQLVIDQVPSLDVKRTFIFTLLGFVLVGPTLHLWYLYLSKLVTMPGASGAFLRLILDQFLFAPTFIGIFLATLVTLEGRPSQVIPKLQQEWFSSVLANWQLWIPFQFLNFRFVPQQFQVLAANVISLVWNVILSYKAHKEVIQK